MIFFKRGLRVLMYTKILTCFLFVIFFGSINAQSEIIIIHDLSLKVDRDQTRYLVQNKILYEITFHNDKKFYENQSSAIIL